MSAAVGACSPGGSPTEDVAFSIPDVSPLMESESAVVLYLTDSDTGKVSASEVIDINGETDVDDQVSVPPGTYSVRVAQLPCPMGGGCADEASAPEFVNVGALWECETTLTVEADVAAHVRVERTGPMSSEDRRCSAG